VLGILSDDYTTIQGDLWPSPQVQQDIHPIREVSLPCCSGIDSTTGRNDLQATLHFYLYFLHLQLVSNSIWHKPNPSNAYSHQSNPPDTSDSSMTLWIRMSDSPIKPNRSIKHFMTFIPIVIPPDHGQFMFYHVFLLLIYILSCSCSFYCSDSLWLQIGIYIFRFPYPPLLFQVIPHSIPFYFSFIFIVYCSISSPLSPYINPVLYKPKNKKKNQICQLPSIILITLIEI